MMPEQNTIQHLRVRRDFLACAKADNKQVRRGLVLQMRPREEGEASDNAKPHIIRFGLTATRKIGNAVIRNRVRRRLRAAAMALLPQYGQGGHDYVLIGRVHSAKRDWQDLCRDLRLALQGFHKEKALQGFHKEEKSGDERAE